MIGPRFDSWKQPFLLLPKVAKTVTYKFLKHISTVFHLCLSGETLCLRPETISSFVPAHNSLILIFNILSILGVSSSSCFIAYVSVRHGGNWYVIHHGRLSNTKGQKDLLENSYSFSILPPRRFINYTGKFNSKINLYNHHSIIW